jgi:hypothetical protein
VACSGISSSSWILAMHCQMKSVRPSLGCNDSCRATLRRILRTRLAQRRFAVDRLVMSWKTQQPEA